MEDRVSVLVVDDDPEFYRALQLALPARDYRLASASDADQSISAMDRDVYDVVITDSQVVGANGVKLSMWLADMYEDTIVIVSYTASQVVQEMPQLTELCYLLKPCEDYSDVTAFIERAIVRKRRDSEQEHHNQAHLEGLENYRSLVESSLDGIIIVGRQGDIKYANPTACSYLGAKLHTLIQQPFPHPINSPDDTEISIQLASGALGQGELRSVRILWRGKDCQAVFIHDVTDYREEETSLRQERDLAQESDQSKTEFLEKTSFEIRTVMQGISGMIELFLDTKLTTEQATFVAALDGSSRTLQQIINNIFRFAGVGCGEIDTETLMVSEPENTHADVRLNPSFHPSVLLVEDDRTNQQVEAKLLEKLGCVVDVVDNGKAAVEAVRTNSYNLVIMDCWMPEMDGFEATKAIRAHHDSGHYLPVIAVTADKRSGIQQQCFEAGMDDLLLKPVSGVVLAGMLEKWLDYTNPFK